MIAPWKLKRTQRSPRANLGRSRCFRVQETCCDLQGTELAVAEITAVEAKKLAAADILLLLKGKKADVAAANDEQAILGTAKLAVKPEKSLFVLSARQSTC